MLAVTTPEELAERRRQNALAWYYANKDRAKENHRRFLEKNPGYRSPSETDREHVRELNRQADKRRRAQRLSAIEETLGRPRPDHCEICGREPNGRRKVLSPDHNHQTGDLRGWICLNCNVALGLVEDDAEILYLLADYLLATTPKWEEK